MIAQRMLFVVLTFLFYCVTPQRGEAQEHSLVTTIGGGFLGDGDLGAAHAAIGYGLQLGKWQVYTDVAIFNGLGARFSSGLLDDWLVNYAYENSYPNRTPYLMYNNGWNSRVGIMYQLNGDNRNSIEIGGGLSLMATNQVDLTTSLGVNDSFSIAGVERVVIPVVSRYLDTGYHFQFRYFYQIYDQLDIGVNFSHQRSFDSDFGVYTTGGINLRYRL